MDHILRGVVEVDPTTTRLETQQIRLETVIRRTCLVFASSRVVSRHKIPYASSNQDEVCRVHPPELPRASTLELSILPRDPGAVPWRYTPICVLYTYIENMYYIRIHLCVLSPIHAPYVDGARRGFATCRPLDRRVRPGLVECPLFRINNAKPRICDRVRTLDTYK